MRKITLSEGLVNGILDYMSKKPYAEVRKYFDAIHAELKENNAPADKPVTQHEIEIAKAEHSANKPTKRGPRAVRSAKAK